MCIALPTSLGSPRTALGCTGRVPRQFDGQRHKNSQSRCRGQGSLQFQPVFQCLFERLPARREQERQLPAKAPLRLSTLVLNALISVNRARVTHGNDSLFAAPIDRHLPCNKPRSEEHTSELQSPCNLV